jgi:hypothetical protein
VDQARPWQKARPYPKITNTKWAAGVPQGVERLPSKHRDLCSTSSTLKKKKKTQKTKKKAVREGSDIS